MSRRIATRVLFGSVMIAALAGVLALDWWLERASQPGGALAGAGLYLVALPLTLVGVAVVVRGFREVSLLARNTGARPLWVTGTLATVAIAALPYWGRLVAPTDGAFAATLTWVLAASLMAIFAEQMLRRRTDGALANLGATVLAVAYLGVPAAVVLTIRIKFGIAALVLFLGAVKFTDIGAYFTGSAMGRHKMIPWLSPGKSWEGLVGGVATGTLIAAAVAAVLNGPLHVPAAVAFGLVVALAGQFADLCESLLKRSADIKDSAALVPEFGGVLDIIDSPWLASPVALAALALLS